jgi:hypothetical protein
MNWNLYVVTSGHIPAMFAIKHSVRRIICRDIKVYIVGRSHFREMCAINLSVRRVI